MNDNKFIRNKYEYWQEDDNCYMLAIENINFDRDKANDPSYLYREYVSKIVVFEELYELIDYLIQCLQATLERLSAAVAEISRLSKKVGE